MLVDEIHDFRPDTKNRVVPAVYISDEIDNEMKGEVKFCLLDPESALLALSCNNIHIILLVFARRPF